MDRRMTGKETIKVRNYGKKGRRNARELSGPVETSKQASKQTRD
jgi:hypothetical protein